MRRKLLFLLSLFLIAHFSFANGIKFLEFESLEELQNRAKKENKIVFVHVYSEGCGYCKTLDTEVFADAAVGAFFNKNFVNIKVDAEGSFNGKRFVSKYNIQNLPTLLFLDSKGEPVHRSVGTMNIKGLLALGGEALDPNQQFYTVMKKADAGKLSPAAMHEWIHKGDKAQESSRHQVLTNYLARTTAPLMEKEMLELVLDHAFLDENAYEMNESKTKELFNARDKIVQLTGRTKESVDQSLLEKFISSAYTNFFMKADEDDPDYKIFQKTIAKYFPGKAALETEKIKVSYNIWREEHETALNSLKNLVLDKKLALPAAALPALMENYGGFIVEQKAAAAFVGYINQYELLPAEKNKVYYKNLALMLLYSYYDLTRTKEYAKKVWNDAHAPNDIKDFVFSAAY